MVAKLRVSHSPFLSHSAVVLPATLSPHPHPRLYHPPAWAKNLNQGSTGVFCCCCCCFFLLFTSSFIPCRKFRSPYLGKATAATRAVLPIPDSESSYFQVSKQWYSCQCLGSLMCKQMLMHVIAHRGFTDTVRESALKADSGGKFLAIQGS